MAVLTPILVVAIPVVAGDVVGYLNDLLFGLLPDRHERIYNEVRDEYAECYAPEVDLSVDDLYDDGAPRALGDVLISSSKELSRLANFVEDSSSQWRDSRMVFLYGAAGSGKSSVVNRLREKSGSAFFHVGDFFRDAAHDDAVMEEQLRYGDSIISSKPKLDESVLGGNTELVDFFERYPESFSDRKGLVKSDVSPADVTVTIIDGLDEIHPESIEHLINSAWRFVARNESKFVILSGRGEAFRQFFEENDYDSTLFKAIYVKPIYVGGDLLFDWFTADFLNWRHEDSTDPSRKRDEVQNLFNAAPFARQFMVTIVPANMVYLQTEYEDEEDLLTFFFDLLARRSKNRHYRPGSSLGDGETWDLYVEALAKIARKFEINGEECGKFVVPSLGTVDISHGDRVLSVNVADTLNYSGFVDLFPFDETHLEYQWFPLPVLKYLMR